MYFKVKVKAEFEMEVEAKDVEQAVQRASSRIKNIAYTTEKLCWLQGHSYFFTLKTHFDEYMDVSRIKRPSEE